MKFIETKKTWSGDMELSFQIEAADNIPSWAFQPGEIVKRNVKTLLSSAGFPVIPQNIEWVLSNPESIRLAGYKGGSLVFEFTPTVVDMERAIARVVFRRQLRTDVTPIVGFRGEFFEDSFSDNRIVVRYTAADGTVGEWQDTGETTANRPGLKSRLERLPELLEFSIEDMKR